MACDPRLTKILLAQYKNFISNPHPNLLAVMDEKDIRIWYFMISGLDHPYQHGEYIFKLTANNEFPHKPPSFEFITMNGVYMLGGAICISVGEFHADQAPGKEGSYGWRPSLGMMGFAIQVLTGLICFDSTDTGIRIMNSNESVKKALAQSSHDWNKQTQTKLYKQFDALMDSHPEYEITKSIRTKRSEKAYQPGISTGKLQLYEYAAENTIDEGDAAAALEDAIIDAVAAAEAEPRVAKAEADRVAKAEADRAVAAKAEADKAAKAEADKAAAKAKAEADKAAAKAEADKVAAAKAEADKVAKAEADRVTAAKAKAEADKVAKAEADKAAKAEADRAAAKAEADRVTAAKAKAEADKVAKAEADKAAKAEADKAAKAAAKAKAEADKVTAAKDKVAEAEAARVTAAKAEAEKVAKAKVEADRVAKVEADRVAKVEADRVAAAKIKAIQAELVESDDDDVEALVKSIVASSGAMATPVSFDVVAVSDDVVADSEDDDDFLDDFLDD